MVDRFPQVKGRRVSLPFWAVALFGFLVVARVTRFLNHDVLALPIRNWFWRRFGDGKLYYLVTCPWCASIWVALPVALLAVLTLSSYGGWPAVWLIGGLWLGWSYVYGMLAMHLDGDE